MSAGRLTGAIMGITSDPHTAPFVQVSILIKPPAVVDQLVINTSSSSLLAQMSIGQTVPIYVALTGADQTAIESAVTVVPFETNQ